ncbi:tRNA (cytidine(34)-2'-O)-methyltransferase [Tistrella mobilis]|uniref:tRNA (cytidine(34)-2'-O)-methyltransferase n=1 Tax=Tistrella mobilis TaxID=171437 RepID=A0A162KVL5_9PROT|nr:tRNA (cytidine(34)-2'-O)-methyltransferase [Tistrella mobilis]KYO52244.1 tRNA methyltransferase [Tistrella mobilis]
MRLALYEPDIPGNAGTCIRLCACLGIGIDIIEPCGFILSDARMKRAGMDYALRATIRRHADWAGFVAARSAEAPEGRLVLATTRGAVPHTDFAFRPDDVLLMGSETAGVPDAVHDAVDARVRIAMVPGMRSLNVAVAASMILGEALRQTGGFPAALTSSEPGSSQSPALQPVLPEETSR